MSTSLTQITAFIAVVEEQGFASAARKLGVSTAAISRQISQLEIALHTQLLRRSTRRMDFTEVGSQYYQHVKQIMAQLHEAELAITSAHSEAVGLLCVSSGYYTVQPLLARLSEFIRLNPKLQVKLELSEGQLSDLSQQPIDIIFGSSLEGPANFVQKRVGSTRFVLCASQAYLDQYGIPKTPLELKHHHYITHSGRNPDNAVTFKNHAPVYVDPIFWVNDGRTLCDCAIKGMGIVKLHHYIVADALQTGRLIEILPEFNEAEKPIYLYYQSSRYLQPKIKRFIDFYTT